MASCRGIEGNEELDGGDLLPGFRLRLADLFADEAAEAAPNS